MRNVILLLGWLFLLPAVAAAQGPNGPPCGDLTDKGADLEFYARYFTDDDLAPVRESLGIQQLTSDVPRRVVDEKKDCGRVFRKLMSWLAKSGELKRLREEGFDFSIFRYGPYYAVLVLQKGQGSPSDEFSTGHGDLIIFRVSDLKHLGRIVG